MHALCRLVSTRIQLYANTVMSYGSCSFGTTGARLCRQSSTRSCSGGRPSTRGHRPRTCATWPAVRHGRLCNTAGCSIWPAVRHGQLCNTAGCAIRQTVQYGLDSRGANRTRGSHLSTNGLEHADDEGRRRAPIRRHLETRSSATPWTRRSPAAPRPSPSARSEEEKRSRGGGPRTFAS